MWIYFYNSGNILCFPTEFTFWYSEDILQETTLVSTELPVLH